VQGAAFGGEFGNSAASGELAFALQKGFIVPFGGNDVFPNLKVGLQILQTVPISVAGCERSFSKMKLIMPYLRSTMTESPLTNLAILSIERETVEKVDFTSD